MHSLKIKEECQVAITEQFEKYLIMKAKNWEESYYNINNIKEIATNRMAIDWLKGNNAIV